MSDTTYNEVTELDENEVPTSTLQQHQQLQLTAQQSRHLVQALVVVKKQLHAFVSYLAQVVGL